MNCRYLEWAPSNWYGGQSGPQLNGSSDLIHQAQTGGSNAGYLLSEYDNEEAEINIPIDEEYREAYPSAPGIDRADILL